MVKMTFKIKTLFFVCTVGIILYKCLYNDMTVSHKRNLPVHSALLDFHCSKNFTWNGQPFRIPQVIIEPTLDGYEKRTWYIYVYTAMYHFDARERIRGELERVKMVHNHTKPKLIFTIGTSQQKGAKAMSNTVMLKQEMKEKQDILQLDFIDTYVNLGFKALGFFNWMLEKRRHVQIAGKIDDDNNRAIEVIFKMFENYPVIDPSKPFMICREIHRGLRPFGRRRKSTWETTHKQYNYSRFPDYCQGNAGMILNKRTMLLLLHVSKYNPIFHIDDIYVSGLLRDNACIGAPQSFKD